MSECKQVSFSEEEGIEGFWGIISLNRPEAYNALSHDMILRISTQLDSWSTNKGLLGVLIHSAFEKAFCAGGDIRTLYDKGKKGDIAALSAFFADEYRLNYKIHHYPKPWLSWINGITMGGGVGISIHGRHRVATETLKFAMPECSIGFFPDVGGSYFLSRMPGELGTYLGLSGATIGSADALYGGLIDHCIAADNYSTVKTQLLNTDFRTTEAPNKIITAILNQHATTCVSSPLAEYRQAIDDCFQGDCVETMVQRLQQHPLPWCQTVAVSLLQKSPLSLKITLEQLRRGPNLDLGACLQMEYGLAQQFVRDTDFYEGVRAQIIDKDKTPHWQPATLSAVKPQQVTQYFATTTNTLQLIGGEA